MSIAERLPPLGVLPGSISIELFLLTRVFGPSSQQKDLHDQVICPIVFEVLEGYNAPFSRMVRLELEKLVQWKEEQGKRMASSQSMQVLFQELLSKFSTY